MKTNKILKQNDLSDEQVLKEFVKRFGCDGAILIYADEGKEFGFGGWRNTKGKKWVDSIFTQINITNNFLT